MMTLVDKPDARNRETRERGKSMDGDKLPLRLPPSVVIISSSSESRTFKSHVTWLIGGVDGRYCPVARANHLRQTSLIRDMSSRSITEEHTTRIITAL